MLSKFFHGQQQLEDDYKQRQVEAKEAAKQGKAKNATLQAIDNVLQIRQIRQYYADLEHMVRYELGMPDLWVDIKEERDRLIEEQKEIERLQRLAERQVELKRQEKLRRLKESIHVYIAGFLGVITVLVSLVLLMWLITWERQWRWGS